MHVGTLAAGTGIHKCVNFNSHKCTEKGMPGNPSDIYDHDVIILGKDKSKVISKSCHETNITGKIMHSCVLDGRVRGRVAGCFWLDGINQPPCAVVIC